MSAPLEAASLRLAAQLLKGGAERVAINTASERR